MVTTDNFYLAYILKTLQCGMVPFVNPGHSDSERTTGLCLLQKAINSLETEVEMEIYDNCDDGLRPDAPAMEAASKETF
jgi:hypothetical protein